MNGATIRITVDGQSVEAEEGCSVAAAIARLGVPFRRSVRGEPRMPLCGMGVCFECRVRIDGVAGQRACMLTVRAGMQVITDG